MQNDGFSYHEETYILQESSSRSASTAPITSYAEGFPEGLLNSGLILVPGHMPYPEYRSMFFLSSLICRIIYSLPFSASDKGKYLYDIGDPPCGKVMYCGIMSYTGRTEKILII